MGTLDSPFRPLKLLNLQMIARNDASKFTPFFNFVPSAVVSISCKFNAGTQELVGIT